MIGASEAEAGNFLAVGVGTSQVPRKEIDYMAIDPLSIWHWFADDEGYSIEHEMRRARDHPMFAKYWRENVQDFNEPVWGEDAATYGDQLEDFIIWLQRQALNYACMGCLFAGPPERRC